MLILISLLYFTFVLRVADGLDQNSTNHTCLFGWLCFNESCYYVIQQGATFQTSKSSQLYNGTSFVADSDEEMVRYYFYTRKLLL